jgi:anti-sigma-K factor RskA
MNYLKPELLQALARDYAVGTLQGGARRRFKRLLREHAAAAVAAAQWQEHFSVLQTSVAPMQPSAAVWRGLQARLFTPAAAAPSTGWRAWLSLAALSRVAAGALVGVLASTVLLQNNPAWLGHEIASEKLPASYVGLLSDAQGAPTVLASSRRHGQVLTLKILRPLAVPTGSTAQLWALPKDGSAAVRLGAVPDKGSGTLALPRTSEKMFSQVERLAVSVEVAGSMPTAPQQPFVVIGPCVKLW